MSSFTLSTPHGQISVTDTALKNDNPPLLLIHGNSSSSKIWRHVFESPHIANQHRIIAFDLPGHGSSSDAPDPETTYCMRSYAELAVHILQHLNIARIVVVGWSLGGHVGIEMLSLLSSFAPNPDSDSQDQTDIKMSGLMLIGTPPALGREQINQAFKFHDPHLGIAARQEWTEEETRSFARETAARGKENLYEQWMEDDARRTDGRSRSLMWKKFAAEQSTSKVRDAMQFQARLDCLSNGSISLAADQRKVVETENVLTAVVNGADEPYVNLEYLEDIKWKRLWRGQCVRLDGLGHAPFWEMPDVFDGLLVDFIADCERVKDQVDEGLDM